mgnify:CR=1 FL=1
MTIAVATPLVIVTVMTTVVSAGEAMAIIMVVIVSRALVPTFVGVAVVFAPMFVGAKVSITIPIVISVPRIVIPVVVVVGERERSSYRIDPITVVVIGIRDERCCESGNQNAGTEYFYAAMFHLCLQFVVGRHTLALGQ